MAPLAPIAMASIMAALNAIRIANVLTGGALTAMILGTMSKAQAPVSSASYQNLKLTLVRSAKSWCSGGLTWALLDGDKTIGYLALDDQSMSAKLGGVIDDQGTAKPSGYWVPVSSGAMDQLAAWLAT